MPSFQFVSSLLHSSETFGDAGRANESFDIWILSNVFNVRPACRRMFRFYWPIKRLEVFRRKRLQWLSRGSSAVCEEPLADVFDAPEGPVGEPASTSELVQNVSTLFGHHFGYRSQLGFSPKQRAPELHRRRRQLHSVWQDSGSVGLREWEQLCRTQSQLRLQPATASHWLLAQAPLSQTQGFRQKLIAFSSLLVNLDA